MGLADLLIKLQIPYGSKESLEVAHTVGKIILNASINASSTTKGEHALSKEDLFASNMKDLLNPLPKEVTGLNNTQLLTIAPTGTLSSMLNISGGIEPIFALSYNRTTKSLHGKDVVYKVYPKIVQDYFKGADIDIDKLPNYYVSSADIKPEDRVKMQGVFQTYIDASISSTVNLPESATVEDVKKIYIDAWKNRLKGITIFRSGCKRTAILSTDSPIKHVKDVQKRPKELKTDYYEVKVKGKLFIVLVGLLNDKPYEVFCYEPKELITLGQHQGIITKHKKMHYSFKSEFITIPDLQSTHSTIEEKATTLYMSMLLRHNVDIKYVIKTAKKVDDNLISFTSALCRVLNKYIPVEVTDEKCPECKTGNIINENGCRHCDSCGYSACS